MMMIGNFVTALIDNTFMIRILIVFLFITITLSFPLPITVMLLTLLLLLQLFSRMLLFLVDLVMVQFLSNNPAVSFPV